MPLNILVITNRLPYPLDDGGNIATFNVLKFLTDIGHSVTLASLNTKRHRVDPENLRGLLEVYTVDIDTSVKIGGILKAGFNSIPYIASRFESKEFSMLLKELLLTKQYDIVQLEGIYLSFYLPVIREFSNAKVVLRAHNVEHKIWQRLAVDIKGVHKKIYLYLLSKKIKRFEVSRAPDFDGIVAITELDREWFNRQFPNLPVKSITAGMNLPEKKNIKIENSSLEVCLLGSFDWIPNVQGVFWFVRDIWPLVIGRHPEAHLHIAGKNPSNEILELNGTNIHVHGYVPDSTKFLLDYPVLAVPLKAGGGMRIKVLEAMALGRCVVSTSIGVEGIPLRPGEDFLLANSASEFADSLIEALSDVNLQRKLGANARKIAEENYNWEELIKSFEEFYKTLQKRAVSLPS